MASVLSLKGHNNMSSTPSLLENMLLTLCERNGGRITFETFMENALYAPQVGYYQSAHPKFGAEGDFVTAPHISPVFSQCLAKVCQKTLKSLEENAIILELGAGNGQLAIDLLLWLETHESLPKAYWILETSGSLKQEQQNRLQKSLPKYFDNIVWLSELPPKFDGILIANEVLDALPVARFRIHPTTGAIQEEFVTYQNDEWQIEYDKPESPDLMKRVDSLMHSLPHQLPPGYTSEINLILPYFIASFAERLQKGIMLWIDYGFPQTEFYHPDRTQGTRMCHHKHHAHDTPLKNIGTQDITAHVDFTALAVAAQAAKLDILGFTTQANYLIYAGLSDLLSEDLEIKAQLHQSQAIQTLTLPHEMGELFKVMILGKNVEPLADFTEFDQRRRL